MVMATKLVQKHPFFLLRHIQPLLFFCLIILDSFAVRGADPSVKQWECWNELG